VKTPAAKAARPVRKKAPAKTKAEAPVVQTESAAKPAAKARTTAASRATKAKVAARPKVPAKPRATGSKAAAATKGAAATKAAAAAKVPASSGSIVETKAKPAPKAVTKPRARAAAPKAPATRRRKAAAESPAVGAVETSAVEKTSAAEPLAAQPLVAQESTARARTTLLATPPPAVEVAPAVATTPEAASAPALAAPPVAASPSERGNGALHTAHDADLGLAADLDDDAWDAGADSAVSVDDVLAGVSDDLDGDAADDDQDDRDDDPDDDQDDDDQDDDEPAQRAADHDEDDEDDDQDDDDQDDGDDDDTPLGESVTTEAGGGLDPAVAAAARRLGIQRLYPEQERGIGAALDGRDVLIVMPTGFGKSACYQVPSMVLPKPVVLISPLLALLKDQHEKLIKYNVPCVRIDGTVRGKARAEAMERIARGGSLLVMTTPESLGSEEMYHVLTKSGISLAAIDEAHCISEWGFDFRPAYLRLGETLRKLGRPPLLALTATATEKVRTDIVRYLGMRDATIVASSPHRSNLAFEVLECREAARLRALARLAQRLRRPGIIYCSTTREVDTVFTILTRLGIPTHRYHGKMAAGDRVKQQDLFMKPGRRTVMVATSAFGLGIDKPDIRYVVHQQSPASLEQYVQEAGRAGRDGAKANCILLHDSSDRAVHEALLSRSRLRPDQLYKLGSALAAWAAEGRTPTIDALALSADLGERPTNALLATLEEAGLVTISEDFLVRATVAPAEVEEKVRSLAGQFANMRTQDSRRLDSVADYAQDGGCRAVYLRSYFGEEHGGACGLCDVCRGRPDRPSTFWSPVAAPKRVNKKRRRGRGRNGQQQPQHQQHQGRRRRGRGGRNQRGGGPNQQPIQMRGGPRQQQHPQHSQHPQRGQQPGQHPNQHPGGPPRDPSSNAGANDGQQRSRRRRRRGRRGRRGRPQQAPQPTPTGEG